MISLIQKTENFVKANLANDSAHDWYHVERVWKMAVYLAQQVKAAQSVKINLFVVEMAALLHDVDDWKFHEKSIYTEKNRVQSWLDSLETIKTEDKQHIINIIREISFKGAGVVSFPSLIEGKIIQDADRLDAIGAIGIARVFSYGGFKKRELYNPTQSPERHQTFEAYQKNQSSSINHFYEKLLLLKDQMNTEAAKHIAEKRHIFMLQYLDQFFSEWNG